jgi:hypothetical protein
LELKERSIMNCRDFDQIWNQSLDARRRQDGEHERERDQELREHAAACPSCRVRHRQFEALRQALEVWTLRVESRPAPTPSPELIERIIEAAARPEPTKIAFRPRRGLLPRLAIVALATAAAVFAMIGPGLRPTPPQAVPAPAVASGPRLERGLLGVAVDDATAASWQLARLASEPARRLGREMIDASFQPVDLTSSTDLDLPALDAGSISPALLSQMSDVLAAGVRPLSTSARQAFGFLRAPRSEKSDRPIARPTEKGA